MTLVEMRIMSILGLLVIGAFAILASLAVMHLRELAQRLNTGLGSPRALPSLRGDARDVARAIDHRQAAWRLRC